MAGYKGLINNKIMSFSVTARHAFREVLSFSYEFIHKEKCRSVKKIIIKRVKNIIIK